MNLKLKSYLYVYIGTIMYTIASYYHLSLKEWSFLKALKIAIPLVLIEYTFSLTGNRILNETFNINPVEILLITMCFYFVNTWLLNYFVIKNKLTTSKEIISFVLIFMAFYLSSNIRIQHKK